MGELITPQEAADRLKICKKTVLRMIKDGRLSRIQIGYRTIRVDADEIERFRVHKQDRPPEVPHTQDI